MAKSFADLEAQETVTSQELLETLQEYSAGSSINADAVIKLIDRAPMTHRDLGEVFSLAAIGEHAQRRAGFPQDAVEYQRVAMHAICGAEEGS